MTSEKAPYMIETLAPGQAVVRFSEICDHTRTTAHEKQLSGLVEAHSHIACDLSQTRVMTSDWLRWLGRLTIKAKKINKEFVVVGVSESLLESADALALKGKFNYARTGEEVWAL
jgi:anti-anti-sigma regulatory factor